VTDCPKTLIEAVRYFADEAACQEYMRRVKWPDGKVSCPKCSGESVSPVKGRPLLQCNNRECKKQFSYKIGTIFEESKLPLGHWFVAIWAIANCKNGISSHELARALGVQQKTAWFLLHRIRLAMEAGSFNSDNKLTGEVESDETFVGAVGDCGFMGLQ
jgi:transposase-like protein